MLPGPLSTGDYRHRTKANSYQSDYTHCTSLWHVTFPHKQLLSKIENMPARCQAVELVAKQIKAETSTHQLIVLPRLLIAKQMLAGSNHRGVLICLRRQSCWCPGNSSFAVQEELKFGTCTQQRSIKVVPGYFCNAVNTNAPSNAQIGWERTFSGCR